MRTPRVLDFHTGCRLPPCPPETPVRGLPRPALRPPAPHDASPGGAGPRGRGDTGVLRGGQAEGRAGPGAPRHGDLPQGTLPGSIPHPKRPLRAPPTDSFSVCFSRNGDLKGQTGAWCHTHRHMHSSQGWLGGREATTRTAPHAPERPHSEQAPCPSPPSPGTSRPRRAAGTRGPQINSSSTKQEFMIPSLWAHIDFSN